MKTRYFAWSLVYSVLIVAGSLASDSRPVGVMDHRLVSQENWVKPWKADWQSGKIAGLLEQKGLKAETIGLDVLREPARLQAYRAILIPTDECYPDEGHMDGPISKNLATYVKSGGILVLPMGASFCRWKDVNTGAVAAAYQAGQPDFLGLVWQNVGDHAQAGPALKLTTAGVKIGLPNPCFSSSPATYARAYAPLGEIYVSNTANQPCLVASDVGNGIVIHYSGGLPLDREVRDWLIAAYAAILKSEPSVSAMRSLRLLQNHVYALAPVAERADAAATGKASQIVLTADEEWELAAADCEVATPADELSRLQWTKVKLPATVPLALFQAGKAPNPWYADNYKQLRYIQKKDWYLRRGFRIPEQWRGRTIRLRFDGLDYFAAVWLDGQFLGLHEGMAGGPTFDVSSRLQTGKEHTLLVRLLHEPAADEPSAAALGGDAIKSKAVDGLSYQWGNRYRSIGIWQPVRLVCTGQAFCEAPVVQTDAISPGKARLSASAMITNIGAAFEGTIRARIIDLQSGRTVWQEESKQKTPEGISYWERSIELNDPKLWWPNGMGDHPLYRLEIALASGDGELDAISTRFGIRTIEMRRNPTLPEYPRSVHSVWDSTEPMDNDMMQRADESYRFMFVVNGRPFYAKGACWLTSDDLLALTPERERWLAQCAQASHINLFRLNGGCNIFETEQLFNLCDELGILIWQELPFCWNGGHTASRSAWREQLMQTVLRLRQHPSLAVYFGGNEFSPYLEGNNRLVDLGREIFACYDNRPFRMSSPGGGTHHAYMLFDTLYCGDPNWYDRLYHAGYNFVSEWSYDTLADYSLLRRIAPAAELKQGPVGCDWQKFSQSHPILMDRYAEVGVGAMGFAKASWYADFAKADLAEAAECSQMAQAEVYGSVMEDWRAQFPYKGGQTVWTYNEMAPASSWHLIDWFGQPSISYYAAKRAHEPTHVFARMHSYSWAPGDDFRAAVSAVCDAPAGASDATFAVRLLDEQMRPVHEETWKAAVPGGGIKSPERPIAWKIPEETPDGYCFLELTLSDPSGLRLSRQAYWLRVLKSLAEPSAKKKHWEAPQADALCTHGPWLKPIIAALPTKLEAKLLQAKNINAEEAEFSVEIVNRGDRPAFPVRLSLSPYQYAVRFSDNFFWLAAGEKAVIMGVVKLNMKGLDPVTNPSPVSLSDLTLGVSAWNSPQVVVKFADVEKDR